MRTPIGTAVTVIGGALLLGGAHAFAPPDKPTRETDTCLEGGCHADLVTRRVMHGPAAQQKCLACHVYDEPRDHRFSLADEEGTLCLSCHNLPTRTYAHEPFRSPQCTGCHDPHGSEHRMMLVADPARDLCQQCHRQWSGDDKQFVHGPVASGACILCHEPHSSWHPKLLTEPAEQLCLGCHAEMVPAPGTARHLHAPVAEGCTTCHDAHASDVRHQLREETPGLCFSCHEDTRAALESAAVVHGAATEAGGCVGCHTPHFSTLPKLQKRGQMEMCLSCHDRPLETADGRTLTDMAALLRANPDHHGPIRDGACSACHLPHAAEFPRLLTKAYPPEFYAPFAMEQYALCFGCHIPALVQDRSGTGLTRFRTGDVNLHWLHVNRQKGRTCRTCHEVHASRNPFHVRDSVPFGSRNWALEIGYERTPSGGSCAPGCHRPQEYDRGPDGAEAAVAPPASGDTPGDTPGETPGGTP